MTKLLEIPNSNYPYLFSHNNETMLIYGYTESSVTRIFGSSTYTIKPYKLHLTNVNSYNSRTINTPTISDIYGQVLYEFNPQIIQNNNTISLIYNAAFSMGDDGPIIYNLCSIDSEDYTFSNLFNFQILSLGWTGKIPENSDIIYGTIDIPIVELLYMTKVFNSDNYIAGCRMESGYCAYLFDSAASTSLLIKNTYTTLYNDYIAYVVSDNIFSDNFPTSIIVEQQT